MKCWCLIRRVPDGLYPSEQFAAGVRASGDDFAFDIGPPGPGDVCVTWNNYGARGRQGQYFKAEGGRHMVLENGYFPWGNTATGGRERHYVVSWDGYNGLGDDLSAGETDPARWEKLGLPILDWHYGGRHILILGQRGGSYMAQSMPLSWPTEIVHRLSEKTLRPIHYRPHPEKARNPFSKDSSDGDAARLRRDSAVKVLDPTQALAEQLYECHAAIAFCSAAALEALRLGVPCFYCGPAHIAAPLMLAGIDEIETPTYPDSRERFFHQLAWAQWSAAELADGTAWRRFAHNEK